MSYWEIGADALAVAKVVAEELAIGDSGTDGGGVRSSSTRMSTQGGKLGQSQVETAVMKSKLGRKFSKMT